LYRYSAAALARAEFGRGQLVQRQELLGQIASVLKQQAQRLHMAVFVTNQVTTRLGAAATAIGASGGGGGGGGGSGGGGEGGDGENDGGGVVTPLDVRLVTWTILDWLSRQLNRVFTAK
jgi:hypothetical protein